MPTRIFTLIISFFTLFASGYAQEEFKIKREQNFEFQVEPTITKNEKGFDIYFETKGFCDVTIVIEDLSGKILRHLASGVLGANAPEPLSKNSKTQKIYWDGKNDQEKYLDNLENYIVRVSLGLKPQFEKTLYWTPYRRIEQKSPSIVCVPEGVVVYEGGKAMDFIRMYQHDGSYLRSVYPFSNSSVKKVTGLLWHNYPQDGKDSPLKTNFLQNTMLTSGDNSVPLTYKADKKEFVSVVGKAPQHYGMSGSAATAIAVQKNKLALVHLKLNRLGLNGDNEGQNLEGPKTSITTADREKYIHGKNLEASPKSCAISPDGEWLYLTGYSWTAYQHTGGYWVEWLNCLARIKYDGSGSLEIIAGSDKLDEIGADNAKLNTPTSVITDSKGNIYVTDYMNDRIQVFTADGKYKRSISVTKPVCLTINEKTNEFYVGSWFLKTNQKLAQEFTVAKPTLQKYSNLENPKLLQTYILPFDGYSPNFSQWDQSGGQQFKVVVDIYSDIPRVWVVAGSPPMLAPHQLATQTVSPWEKFGTKIYKIEQDKLVLEKDFGNEANKAVARLVITLDNPKKIYVNPKSELLYLWEGQTEDGTGAGKASQELIEIDPKTGISRKLPLPFDAEDIAFDSNNMMYLKTRGVVARFQIDTMKEVPWDYGSEEQRVGFASGKMGKQSDLVSGLKVPGNLNWQHGGMFITPKGELVVASYLNPEDKTTPKDSSFKPTIYPGRALSHSHGGTYINVWNQHGQVMIKDAIPGLAELDGIGMDVNGNLYMMTHATRIFNNKTYFNDLTGTILRFSKGKGKILSINSKSVAIELEKEQFPKRSLDLIGAAGSQWAEECDWLYGGVGYGGKNKGVGCACWNSKYTLDYLGRSFAPEIDRYKIAVLDSNGNLILRIGQFGNVDDGMPIDIVGGPSKPNSIGSDEVALFHGAFLATQSDKTLYIADPGNLRILKVKLNYYAEKKISFTKN